MQIRRGCRGWKIGHPSFSDNLDPKEHKSAKKSILANDAHRSPFFDHKDLHYTVECLLFARILIYEALPKYNSRIQK